MLLKCEHETAQSYSVAATLIAPGDVPITAEGLWVKELAPKGRRAQSIA